MEGYIPIILLLIVVAVVIFNITTARKPKVKPQCIYCESNNVIETGRDPKGSRMTRINDGGMGVGADIRLQIEFEGSYRCESCGKTFKKRFTETQ
ncbi:MAG: hypothetical protein AAF614_21400 [Chloroflexota bacterium]